MQVMTSIVPAQTDDNGKAGGTLFHGKGLKAHTPLESQPPFLTPSYPQILTPYAIAQTHPLDVLAVQDRDEAHETIESETSGVHRNDQKIEQGFSAHL